ncbi:hypothetical protein GGF32_007227 [Allomyces javanicus]|nr:hypothetical protein GGF32_007227 [Allomyces javanicus]
MAVGGMRLTIGVIVFVGAKSSGDNDLVQVQREVLKGAEAVCACRDSEGQGEAQERAKFAHGIAATANMGGRGGKKSQTRERHDVLKQAKAACAAASTADTSAKSSGDDDLMLAQHEEHERAKAARGSASTVKLGSAKGTRGAKTMTDDNDDSPVDKKSAS